MKKSRFSRIMAVITLLSAVTLLAGLAACNGNPPEGNGTDELRTSTYYGESSEGIVEVTFSSKAFDASVQATGPRDGDYYIIKLNGALVSSGQVTIPASGGSITFVPSASGSSEFNGTLGSGGALAVPAIPLAGGTVSLPSTNPSSSTVAALQGAAIGSFSPVYKEITSSGFSIEPSTAAAVSASPNTGQAAEYAVSKSDAAPIAGWQKGLDFTGLDAATKYYVWARSGAKVTAAANYLPGNAARGEGTVTTAASARGLLEKLNSLSEGAAELVDDSTVELTGTVALSERLEIEEGVTLIVSGGLAIGRGGRLYIGGTMDIGAGAWAGPGAAITLAESGTAIVPSGATVAELNASIADIKEIDRWGPGNSGKVVIQLTQGFYAAAAGDYIVIDPGDNENTVPYTIRGLGKDASMNLNDSDIPKLGVGILLANSNVTLEDISIKIPATSRGLMPSRPWAENAQGTVTNAYSVALLIGRAKAGVGEASDFICGSKGVTVQNCAIAVASGPAGESFTGGIWVYGNPSDIKVLGNTVTVTGKGDNAAQALAFDSWGDNIQVKDNKLTAKFANQPNLQNLNPDDFYIRPASAIYIRSFYEKPESGTYKYYAGDISGNAFSYDPTKASVFSFYINAFPRSLPESTNESRKGVVFMGSKKFGSPGTKWAIDPAALGDCHRLVVGDLIKDCTSTGDGSGCNGFGTVLMYVSYKKPDNVADNNVETYKIAGGKLVNIGIYAWTLVNGDYVFGGSTINANVTVNPNGTTTPGTGSHLRYWK